MIKKNLKWYLLVIIFLIGIIAIPITFSKYISTFNKKITVNVRKPKYTVSFFKNDLPEEYQEVEYIQATGTQWIDTKVPMNGNYVFFVDGSIPEGKIGVLVNGYDSTSARQGIVYYTGSNKIGFYWFGKGYSEDTTLTSKGIDLKQRFQVTQSSTELTLVQDNLVLTQSYNGTTTTNAKNIYIFNSDANASYKNGTLYQAKITNNGTAIRDFIPCYRKSDGEIGLYDIVEGEFYTNKGTGIFVKGNNVGEQGTMSDQQFVYGTAQNLTKNIFTKKGYIFGGWNTKPDGTGTTYTDQQSVINLSSVDGANIKLYAQWSVPKIALVASNGQTLLAKMKQFANNGVAVTDPYGTVNTNITAFKKATEAQYNAIKNTLTADNVISTTSSHHSAYMWFDSATGTIYVYTDADEISLTGNMGRMFAKMQNLADISGLEYFDTSEVTDMNRMFQDVHGITDLSPIANWDTSKVTDMTFMFGSNGTTTGLRITSLDALKDWDVSSVTSLNQTFKNCTLLASLDGVKDWDVSSVTSLNQTFNRCAFTDATAIEGWDVTNVTTFNMMFANNTSLPNDKRPIFTVRPGSWNNSGTYTPN